MERILSLITIFLVLALSGRCTDVNYSRNDFPEGFVFGSAVSAYQVPISIFNYDFRFSSSSFDSLKKKVMFFGF